MKKKGFINALLVVLLVLMVLSSVFIARWFKGETLLETRKDLEEDPGQEKEYVAYNLKGHVHLTRQGITYRLNDGDRLKEGDTIETLLYSELTLKEGEASIRVDEKTSLCLLESGELEILEGSILLEAKSENALRVDKVPITSRGLLLVSRYPGSTTLTNLKGEVHVQEESLPSGKSLLLLEEERVLQDLDLKALSPFALKKLMEVTELNGSLKDEVSKLLEERQALRVKDEADSILGVRPSEELQEAGIIKEPSALEESGSENEEALSQVVTSSSKKTITLEIRCDTILNNLEDLTPGKEMYVPSDGTILATSVLEIEEGDTAFDVLVRACEMAGIQIEYSWTPMYSSYYVEGINHLYEFDCGVESGWMYKVNEWFPNYGSSAYTLKDGDVMVWTYTCQGLGADVGGSVY